MFYARGGGGKAIILSKLSFFDVNSLTIVNSDDSFQQSQINWKKGEYDVVILLE